MTPYRFTVQRLQHDKLSALASGPPARVYFQSLADLFAEVLVTRKYSDSLVQGYLSTLGKTLVPPETPGSTTFAFEDSRGRAEIARSFRVTGLSSPPAPPVSGPHGRIGAAGPRRTGGPSAHHRPQQQVPPNLGGSLTAFRVCQICGHHAIERQACQRQPGSDHRLIEREVQPGAPGNM